jgi:lysozyme
MKVSTQGQIDIIGREGICLSPYLDSVGVWTIGAGQTKSDGIDPRTSKPITLDQAIGLFKSKLQPYADAVDAENVYHQNAFTQFQYDALLSACYNFGPGNLHQLCRHRTLEQIGAALMLYVRPPEITARRKQEQTLYLTGHYSNPEGQVLLFPVTASHHPDYHHGRMIDIRPYFTAVQPAA